MSCWFVSLSISHKHHSFQIQYSDKSRSLASKPDSFMSNISKASLNKFIFNADLTWLDLTYITVWLSIRSFKLWTLLRCTIRHTMTLMYETDTKSQFSNHNLFPKRKQKTNFNLRHMNRTHFCLNYILNENFVLMSLHGSYLLSILIKPNNSKGNF